MRIIQQKDIRFSIIVAPSMLDPSDIIFDEEQRLTNIISRLERDDNLAWLDIFVETSAAGFTGEDILSGVSLLEGKDINTYNDMIFIEVDFYGMIDNAVESLRSSINKHGWEAEIKMTSYPTDIKIDWI